MIQFLTSTSTVRLIEQIVIDAEDNLVLVSASPHFSEKLMQQLKSADDRGVSIILMVDDVLFEESVADQFSSFEKFSIFRCHDMNGHCYANERSMIVTSLGISDKIPTGVHLGTEISSDEQAYLDAMDTLAEVRESVNLSDIILESSPARKNHASGKKAVRSPILRIIKGGLRKKFNREIKEESRTGQSPSCKACEAALDDSTGNSLCPECEQRKKYRHTALYIASDLTA